MSKSNLVICVGELLIDFFCTDVDVDLTQGMHFEKQAGGAPANVSAAIAKLGGSAAFVGKVGNDPFGVFLKDTLEDVMVDTTMISMDNTTPTTMAFVSLKSDGERDFVFNRGADEQLTLDDIDLENVVSSQIIHFGSATAMLSGEAQNTYFTLMDMAREKEILVTFDPNYRGNLWEGNEKEFISLARKGISKADVVKVSEEELELITSEKDKSEALKVLHTLGCQIVMVTLGKEGTLLSTMNGETIVPSIEVKSIDSTGAGDAFVGAILYELSLSENPQALLNNSNRLAEVVAFANKVGALVCTKVGAITALPSLDEVKKL